MTLSPLGTILVALACAFSTLATAAERPNVVFIAVDDMNDWIGCLETTPRAITPNIDALAARGVNFTNAHTAGVFCAPSRSAIFTGQYASTTGCYRTEVYFHDHPELRPLQVSFKEGGYQCFGGGKLFHHPAGHVDLRGWDEFFVRSQEQRTTGWPLNSWDDKGLFPQPHPSSAYNEGREVTGGLFLEWGAVPNERERELADSIRAEWAVKKLEEQHDTPFFLSVGFYAPHFPNYCPKKYFDLYDPSKISLPPYKKDDLDDLPERIRRMKTNRSKIHQRLEDLDAVEDAIHGYLACMSYADALVGQVLDALENSPHKDNTIVVLWSDHGYHHGEKGDWGKHTLWERTSNVPFIWAGPGIAQGSKVETTVSLIDMYPTLVEQCELPQPGHKLEGTSLHSVLSDPQTAKDRDVLLPHMEPGSYAIMNQDWRYIHYHDVGEELYDLGKDPNEWYNLASLEQHTEVIAGLKKAAPASFAKPGTKLVRQRHLVIEGESFHWDAEADQRKKSPAKKASPPSAQKSSPTKNVLFIVCDDLNTHVSPMGYEPIITPTLAEFASEAMTFHQAFCQYPVCGPSRASFLHGLYPESTGVIDNKADIRRQRPNTPSLPQFFKEQGYWTGSVGKVFHSPRHEHGEVAWDAFLRFENDELPVVREAREAFEKEHGSIEKSANRRSWRTIKKQAAAKLDAQTPPGYGRSGLEDEQHKDGKNAKQVSQWLEKKSYGNKPFFIACGLQKPHVPFLAPDKYFDRYPTDKIVYKPDRSDLWESLPKMAKVKRYEAFGFELGQENDSLRREYMQAYHACISFIDAQLELVFDSLKQSGHWDDTIVVFLSDHGYHLGDHFLWGKVTLFDIGARVPLIVRVPGLTQGGKSSEAMVELIDLYPTLADLTGLAPPPHLQGQSLRPVLGHPDRKGKKRHAYTVVSRSSQLGYALRNQRWRYGKWPDGEELYNLAKDPSEKHNLADDPKFTKRLEDFRKLLEAKQTEAASQRNAHEGTLAK